MANLSQSAHLISHSNANVWVSMCMWYHHHYTDYGHNIHMEYGYTYIGIFHAASKIYLSVVFFILLCSAFNVVADFLHCVHCCTQQHTNGYNMKRIKSYVPQNSVLVCCMHRVIHFMIVKFDAICERKHRT